MRANLAQREPQTLARWQTERVYERALDARASAPRYVFHDGPPYANGAPALRPRPEQDPQGHRGQVPADGRASDALRAGLGLPRPADRVERRTPAAGEGQEARAAGAARRVPQGSGEVGARAIGRGATPGRVRHLGCAVPDDEPELRARHPRGARRVRAPPDPVSRQEAGALVRALPHRARRSRGRIPRPRLAQHLREVSGARAGRERARAEVRARRRAARASDVRADLDDHAVDAAREPRDRRASRVRVRRRGRRRRAVDRGRRVGERRARRHQAPRRAAWRQAARCGAGRQRRAPSVRGPRIAALRRGLRHARGRHRARAHGPRTRRGRLPPRSGTRARHLRAGRRSGALHRRSAARVARPARARGQPEDRPLPARDRRACEPRRRDDRAQLPVLLALQESGDLPCHHAVVHRARSTTARAQRWKDAARARAFRDRRDRRTPRPGRRRTRQRLDPAPGAATASTA